MVEAVKLASEADAVVAFIGLNGDWETEGNDRVSLDLPGRTNELVEKIFAANPNTVVVNQSVSRPSFDWSYSEYSWYRDLLY
jgi:beta-glucosidase